MMQCCAGGLLADLDTLDVVALQTTDTKTRVL